MRHYNTDLKWIGHVRVVCAQITTSKEWNDDAIDTRQLTEGSIWWTQRQH